MKIRVMLLTVLLCTPAIISAEAGNINGTWNITMNGYPGTITFNGAAGVLNMTGFPPEKIINVAFDGTRIQFKRVSYLGPTGDQEFKGTVSDYNLMVGTLTQPYFPGSIYQWNATRPELIPPPPGCNWQSFSPDPRTFAAQPGRVFPLEAVTAGIYMIYVAPTGKNGLLAPAIAKGFGPKTLQSEHYYKAVIRMSGKALGWEEESADLLSYQHPLPGLSRIYVRNDASETEWYAICLQWMGPIGGGGGGDHTGIDIIEGIWTNTDHIHRGCRDVQSFCKAYKVDVQFSRTADGALEGQIVGQPFVMVGGLQGQTWDFSITMNGNYHGKGSFVFSQDFKSFNGELTDVNGHHVVWTGSR
jgi:hypothetical protein